MSVPARVITKTSKVTAVAGTGSSTNRSAGVRNVRRPGKNWVQGKCDDAC